MKNFFLIFAILVCHSQALPQSYGSSKQKCKVVTTVEYEETYVPDCTTVYENVCNTLYRKKCNNYQDEVCNTVQKRKCDTKRKQECRTEYRSVSEPYTEQKCDKIEKCEKAWMTDGYGNKVWEEDKSNCLYEDKCYDVNKQRQVKQPYEQCDWKNYQDCYNVPDKQCSYVTKQRCDQEPYQDCKDVPKEKCTQIHKQIPREIKKRVCDNNDYDYNDYDNDAPYSASDVGNAFVNERNNNVKTKDVNVDIRSGSNHNNNNNDDDKIIFGR